MAHHGNDELSKYLADKKFPDMDEFKKSMPAEQTHRINDLLSTMPKTGGPTGNYPDGKLSDDDDGEIQFGICHVERRIIMNFDKPIKWIGFTRDQAIEVANALLKHAEKARD